MKKKYDLQRVGRGFLISPIADNTVRFTEKILSCKLLRKSTVGTIELAEQCAAGVIFNWSQCLLNELLEDV